MRTETQFINIAKYFVAQLIILHLLLLAVTPPGAGAQSLSPLILYEFNQATLAANGWCDPTGGYLERPAGTASVMTFAPEIFVSSQDQQGLAVTVKPNEVAFLHTISAVDTLGGPAMLRMTVRASAPEASVALAALRGDLNGGNGVDGSIATHIPATAADFVNMERRIVLLYEPDNGHFMTPVIQVAATGLAGEVTVYIDKLEILKLDEEEFGSQPYAKPTSTPTPPTPTTTPTPVTLPQTVTIPLPNLPLDAKPLEMVLIKAGTFAMGSPADEQDRTPEEWLPHPVTLTKDFYLGRYEVTQAQYEAIMNGNPSNGYGVGPNYPVYYATWYDGAAFCNRLSQREGFTPVYDETNWTTDWNADGYRLPTEAEWEYACRAGTTTRFSFGDALECVEDPPDAYCEILDENMWWSGNNDPNGAKEVGLKLPNPWGLFDMHGNVWEWCNDWWEEPWDEKPQVDPKGQETGTYRVVRGGGWNISPAWCRSAIRNMSNMDSRRENKGFRVSRNNLIPGPTSTPTPTPLPPTPTPTSTQLPPSVSITVPLPNLPDGAKPLEMVLIKSGTFMMGSPEDEKGRFYVKGREVDWRPHEVTLTRDFYLGRFEVTQAQYQTLMKLKMTLPKRSGVGLNYPVYGVSWYDAAAFCNRLSEGEGLTLVYDETAWDSNRNANGYRLPTEAEWEYACRAGTTTRFSFGDALECDDENYCEIMDRNMWWWGNYDSKGSKEVGLKLPNPWILFDMHGGVWEWCEDWWEYPYDRGPQGDPICEYTEDAKVTRGGSGTETARCARSAYRTWREPAEMMWPLGFRIAKTK
ncbi:MAG: formylglycine-generating enzyme family protein [bacterium]